MRMRRDERGANLVEAALVVPILVLILAGVVDLGRAFSSYIVIANAAREGARAGARFSCYRTDSTQRATYRQMIVDSILNELTGSGVDPDLLTYTITPDPATTNDCPRGAEEVRVTVTYPEDMILVSYVGIATINLNAAASMSRVGETGQY